MVVARRRCAPAAPESSTPLHTPLRAPGRRRSAWKVTARTSRRSASFALLELCARLPGSWHFGDSGNAGELSLDCARPRCQIYTTSSPPLPRALLFLHLRRKPEPPRLALFPEAQTAPAARESTPAGCAPAPSPSSHLGPLARPRPSARPPAKIRRAALRAHQASSHALRSRQDPHGQDGDARGRAVRLDRERKAKIQDRGILPDQQRLILRQQLEDGRTPPTTTSRRSRRCTSCCAARRRDRAFAGGACAQVQPGQEGLPPLLRAPAAARDQLPQEGVRPHEPAAAEEEAQVDCERLLSKLSYLVYKLRSTRGRQRSLTAREAFHLTADCARSRSPGVSTPGAWPSTSPTAIAIPASSARSCSRRSARSSADGGSATKRRSAAARKA